MDLLDRIWTSISESTPRVLLAVLILLVGWLAARVLSKAIFVLLARTRIDDWASKRLGIETGGRYGHRIERILARSVFYVLLIVVMVLVLNVLEFQEINQPLLNLLDEVLQALPKVLLAGIIVFLAFVVGKLLSFSLTRVLKAARLDERVTHLGGIETTEGQLSTTLGAIAFWFVMVVGVVQGLDALGMDSLVQPLRGALDELASMLPNLVGAVLLLVLGGLAIRWVARIATRLLTDLHFDEFVEKVGLVRPVSPGEAAAITADESAPQTAKEDAAKEDAAKEDADDDTALAEPEAERLLEQAPRRTPAEVASMVLAIVLALLLIGQVLSIIYLDRLAGLVDTVIAYLPDVGVAFVIISAGVWAGNWVKARADELYAAKEQRLQRFLGAAGRIAVLVFASAIALQQLGVAPELITTAFGILFGAVCLALALAFGLGGRAVAGTIVQNEYDKYDPPSPAKAPTAPKAKRSRAKAKKKAAKES